MGNSNFQTLRKDDKTSIRLTHISNEINKLMAKGWNHISIIKTVDKFFEGKAISNVVVTDINDIKYTVSENMFNDPSIIPGNGVLFKEKLVDAPLEKFHIDDKCGFLVSKDVSFVFGYHLF